MNSNKRAREDLDHPQLEHNKDFNELLFKFIKLFIMFYLWMIKDPQSHQKIQQIQNIITRSNPPQKKFFW